MTLQRRDAIEDQQERNRRRGRAGALWANQMLIVPEARHRTDPTDFRNQPTIAPGGPVERIYPKERPMHEPRVIPGDEAQKPAIARELLAHADQRGWVSLTVQALAARLGFDEHDVTHALWDFQQKGLMKFREHHLGSASTLTALRLTTQGRLRMTELSQRTKPAIEAPVVPAVEPVAAISWPSATAVEEPGYPLIRALVERRENLEAAAALLEKAGQDDLAIATMEKAHAPDLYSPLEAEAVALWEATR